MTVRYPCRELPANWTDCAWIGRPENDVGETEPVGFAEDRPPLTLAMLPPAYLRRVFNLKEVPADSRLFVTALGVYQIFINGIRVGDHVLAPGWTDYHQRVHVQSFAISEYLVPGDNVMAAILADGWYCGYVGFDRGRQARLWGETPRLLARLESGGRAVVGTDSAWMRSSGQYVHADLQMGEMQDPRLEPLGWMTRTFDDTNWLPVETVAVSVTGAPLLVASKAPPIKIIETIRPISITRRPGGRFIVDFGQNLVGVVDLAIPAAKAGTRIHLRHAEVLTEDGDLYVENLRTALAHDIAVCSGKPERFRPQFTFHGFRYVEVDGYPGDLDAASINADILHSDVSRIGWFECSNLALSKLHENIDWSIRGNLLDVATDCPQRDERLGWLGDAGLIMTSASFMRDLDGFLAKWSTDIRDAQGANGAFPDVAPRANMNNDGAPGWADAGAIIPWVSYLHFGNIEHLEANYGAMQRWIGRLLEDNPTLIRRAGLGRNYGDWLNADSPTPKHLIATAYLAYSLEVVAHAAEALGHYSESVAYRRLWERARAAFAEEFIDSDGHVLGETQTGYAMALHLDLVPTQWRGRASELLVANINDTGHLTTGIHGTRFLAPALSDTGHSDLAFGLALSTDSPSWLFTVNHGATTIWERWDGWTPERGFQNPRMNSFNHYAFGSIAEWLHRYVAGILPTRGAPGYGHTVIRPHPDRRLQWAEGKRKTRFGNLSSRWTLENGSLELTIEVPPGATATIFVPRSDESVTRLEGDSTEESTISTSSWSAFQAHAGGHRFRAKVADDWAATPLLSSDRLCADHITSESPI